MNEIDPCFSLPLYVLYEIQNQIFQQVDHPPLIALIREFFSNLSSHIYDSNTLVRSWILGVEFTITPRIVIEALGVSVFRELIYPYEESPPLDDVMSYITRSSIQWGSDPRITSTELTETTYLFFRIACHSLWPISHFHTIPLERCVFLYTLVSGASISFPHLFLRLLTKFIGVLPSLMLLFILFSFIGFCCFSI